MPTKRLPLNQARRGDVRLILLAVLAKQPRHGYGIIRHLEEKSNGAWRPSPGVIYPMLQQLKEEELVTGEKVDSKIVYHLTDRGRLEVETNIVEGPWESDEEMFRHVAWIKEMATQLTQSYLRMIQVADTETIETIRTRTEELIEIMQEETK